MQQKQDSVLHSKKSNLKELLQKKSSESNCIEFISKNQFDPKYLILDEGEYAIKTMIERDYWKALQVLISKNEIAPLLSSAHLVLEWKLKESQKLRWITMLIDASNARSCVFKEGNFAWKPEPAQELQSLLYSALRMKLNQLANVFLEEFEKKVIGWYLGILKQKDLSATKKLEMTKSLFEAALFNKGLAYATNKLVILYHTAIAGDKNLVDYFVNEKKVDFFVHSERGFTAFSTLAGHADMDEQKKLVGLKKLLEWAQCFDKENGKKTFLCPDFKGAELPLHGAHETGSWKVVKYLLKQESNYWSAGTRGDNLLGLILKNKKLSQEKKLIWTKYLVEKAKKEGHFIELMQPSEVGAILPIACCVGLKNVVSYLLEEDVELEKVVGNDNIFTFLLAISDLSEEEQLFWVKSIFDKINTTRSEKAQKLLNPQLGCLPLQQAIISRNWRVVDWLIQAGALPWLISSENNQSVLPVLLGLQSKFCNTKKKMEYLRQWVKIAQDQKKLDMILTPENQVFCITGALLACDEEMIGYLLDLGMQLDITVREAQLPAFIVAAELYSENERLAALKNLIEIARQKKITFDYGALNVGVHPLTLAWQLRLKTIVQYLIEQGVEPPLYCNDRFLSFYSCVWADVTEQSGNICTVFDKKELWKNISKDMKPEDYNNFIMGLKRNRVAVSQASKIQDFDTSESQLIENRGKYLELVKKLEKNGTLKLDFLVTDLGKNILDKVIKAKDKDTFLYLLGNENIVLNGAALGSVLEIKDTSEDNLIEWVKLFLQHAQNTNEQVQERFRKKIALHNGLQSTRRSETNIHKYESCHSCWLKSNIVTPLIYTLRVGRFKLTCLLLKELQTHCRGDSGLVVFTVIQKLLTLYHEKILDKNSLPVVLDQLVNRALVCGISLDSLEKFFAQHLNEEAQIRCLRDAALWQSEKMLDFFIEVAGFDLDLVCNNQTILFALLGNRQHSEIQRLNGIKMVVSKAKELEKKKKCTLLKKMWGSCEGLVLLQYCLAHGYLDIFNYLLNENDSYDVVDENGINLASYILITNNLESGEKLKLLEKLLEMAEKDNKLKELVHPENGFAPIIFACKNNQEGALKLLIEADCKINSDLLCYTLDKNDSVKVNFVEYILQSDFKESEKVDAIKLYLQCAKEEERTKLLNPKSALLRGSQNIARYLIAESDGFDIQKLVLEIIADQETKVEQKIRAFKVLKKIIQKQKNDQQFDMHAILQAVLNAKQIKFVTYLLNHVINPFDTSDQSIRLLEAIVASALNQNHKNMFIQKLMRKACKQKLELLFLRQLFDVQLLDVAQSLLQKNIKILQRDDTGDTALEIIFANKHLTHENKLYFFKILLQVACDKKCETEFFQHAVSSEFLKLEDLFNVIMSLEDTYSKQKEALVYKLLMQDAIPFEALRHQLNQGVIQADTMLRLCLASTMSQDQKNTLLRTLFKYAIIENQAKVLGLLWESSPELVIPALKSKMLVMNDVVQSGLITKASDLACIIRSKQLSGEEKTLLLAQFFELEFDQKFHVKVLETLEDYSKQELERICYALIYCNEQDGQGRADGLLRRLLSYSFVANIPAIAAKIIEFEVEPNTSNVKALLESTHKGLTAETKAQWVANLFAIACDYEHGVRLLGDVKRYSADELSILCEGLLQLHSSYTDQVDLLLHRIFNSIGGVDEQVKKKVFAGNKKIKKRGELYGQDFELLDEWCRETKWKKRLKTVIACQKVYEVDPVRVVQEYTKRSLWHMTRWSVMMRHGKNVLSQSVQKKYKKVARSITKTTELMSDLNNELMGCHEWMPVPNAHTLCSRLYPKTQITKKEASRVGRRLLALDPAIVHCMVKQQKRLNK